MRRAILFAIPAVLAITALWFFFVFQPANTRIEEANTQLEAEKQQETLLRTQLRQLQRVQENELAYLSAIGVLEAAIPPTPQMPVLIDDLSQLAFDSGVIWDGATYGNPTEVEGADYLEIPFTLQVRGQYFELLGYLYGIEDLDRLVRLESININPVDEEGFTVLSVSLTATAFTTSSILVPDFGEEGGDTTTTTVAGNGDTTTTTVAGDTTTTAPSGDTTTTTAGGG